MNFLSLSTNRFIKAASALLITLCLSSAPSLFGHAVGEDYLFLSISDDGLLKGRFEFHRDDLKEKIGIDVTKVSNEELNAQLKLSEEKVHAYILENFWIKADDEPISLHFKQSTYEPLAPQFIQYHFESQLSSVPTILSFKHELMYENDWLHRGMVCLSYNPVTKTSYPEETIALIFNRHQDVYELDLRKPIKSLISSKGFIWQGILHIWIGVDHILFLIVLLLPAVLVRKNGQWESLPKFTTAFFNIFKIVTLFTIAHSISLALAALNIVNLPGQLVESAIAASIILVAANNIFPKFKEASALIIVTFGLFHGLGFATVLGEIPFRMHNLYKILIAFNIGVEIGQLAIVIVVFTILYATRQMKSYESIVLRTGSGVAGAVALFWFVERAFGF